MKDNQQLVGSQGGAWDMNTHQALHPKNFNKGLAEYISTVIEPTSLLEFGSGLGWLSKYINDHCQLSEQYCIEPEIIHGIYDNREGPRILPVNIFRDSLPFMLNHKFDLVMSIEVAEHIERALHDRLFEFLVSHTKNWIVFSGARVGQGGHGHISERDEEEWKAEFLKRGMIFQDDMTESIRLACDKKNINHRRNLLVFKRPEIFQCLDEIEIQCKPYLNDLLKIMLKEFGAISPNPFYGTLQDAINGMPNDMLKEKRLNYINLATTRNNILAFNSNCGYYLLLALVSNPRANVTVIDNNSEPGDKAYIAYLEQVFPGRLSRISADINTSLYPLKDEKFSLIYLDSQQLMNNSLSMQELADITTKDNAVIIENYANNMALDDLLSYMQEAYQGSLELLSGYSIKEGSYSLSSQQLHVTIT